MKKNAESRGINNLEIDKKGDYLIVSINPKIYPLEVIYSAAYVFLDRAYLTIDGNPEEEIFVQMKPKGKENLEKLGLEFNNELVNYSVYVVQATRNQPLRKAIIERALLTNTEEYCPECGAKLVIDPETGERYCPVADREHAREKKYCDKCGCEMIFCEECGDYYCPTCEGEHKEGGTHGSAEEEKWEDVEEDLDFVEDPLGIAKPWTPPKEEGEANEKSKNRQKTKKG